MLGSHNSITGYPCPWYLRVFNIFAKCQSKTIAEQLDAGVRFFDLRVKAKADGSCRFAHGIVSYHANGLYSAVYELMDYMAHHAGETVYYRVMLEYNSEPKRREEIVRAFREAVEFCKEQPLCSVLCPRPRFCGAYQKWDYGCVVAPDEGCGLPITHKYSSCIGWRRFIHCVPYLYARRRNKGFKERYKDTLASNGAVLLLDFI